MKPLRNDLIQIAAAFFEYIEFAEVDDDEGWSKRPACPDCRWDGDIHHPDCPIGAAVELAKKYVESVK